VLVPREILVKTAALTPDELKQVRDSILTSADILALIGFSQPVVPTLRQVLECFDGTGVPEGRKGNAILITARIVMVANVFVAMVSARAHRPGLNVRQALDTMMKEGDRKYDRNVITALDAAVGRRAGELPWLAKA
jgi:HD-GYP domain-containing protein (c-di-GMP phosphodiesterase class II)